MHTFIPISNETIYTPNDFSIPRTTGAPPILGLKYLIEYADIECQHIKEDDEPGKYTIYHEKMHVGRIYLKQTANTLSDGSGTIEDPCTDLKSLIEFFHCLKDFICVDALQIIITQDSDPIDLAPIDRLERLPCLIIGDFNAKTKSDVFAKNRLMLYNDMLFVNLNIRYTDPYSTTEYAFHLPSCYKCDVEAEVSVLARQQHPEYIDTDIKSPYIFIAFGKLYGCTIKGLHISGSTISKSVITATRDLPHSGYVPDAHVEIVAKIISETRIVDNSERISFITVEEMYYSTYEGGRANPYISDLHTIVGCNISVARKTSNITYEMYNLITLTRDYIHNIILSNSKVNYTRIDDASDYTESKRQDFFSIFMFCSRVVNPKIYISDFTISQDIVTPKNTYGYKTTCLVAKDDISTGRTSCIYGCDISQYASGEDMEGKPSCDNIKTQF